MIEGIPCLRLLPPPPPQAGLAPGDTASNKPLGANKAVGMRAREAAGEATQSMEVALLPEHPERCQRHAGSGGMPRAGEPRSVDIATHIPVSSFCVPLPTPSTGERGPYREAGCNLEVLVPDPGQGQGQARGQVLSRTQRVEVVLASAAASRASAASPAPPSAGGRGGAAPWPASCTP